MAESNDPSSANPEDSKTKKPESIAAPTGSPEGETPATTAEENAPAAVSADAGGKPAPPEARPAVKPAKKPARKKSEEAAPAAAAPENLSLSADVVGRQKIVKAKGSKNVHSGIAHVLSTFNNTIVTITDVKGNVIGWSSAGKVGFKRFAQKHSLRSADGRAGCIPAGDGPWAKRSGSLGKRARSRA